MPEKLAIKEKPFIFQASLCLAVKYKEIPRGQSILVATQNALRGWVFGLLGINLDEDGSGLVPLYWLLFSGTRTFFLGHIGQKLYRTDQDVRIIRLADNKLRFDYKTREYNYTAETEANICATYLIFDKIYREQQPFLQNIFELPDDEIITALRKFSDDNIIPLGVIICYLLLFTQYFNRLTLMIKERKTIIDSYGETSSERRKIKEVEIADSKIKFIVRVFPNHQQKNYHAERFKESSLIDNPEITLKLTMRKKPFILFLPHKPVI